MLVAGRSTCNNTDLHDFAHCRGLYVLLCRNLHRCDSHYVDSESE